MPRGSPFTTLCRHYACLSAEKGADLHVHTTASDGEFTPSQVFALAKAAGLAAVAITDHDTLAGLPEAIATAQQFPPPMPVVVSGVEITTLFRGRELHLLGYFLEEAHPGLDGMLERSRDLRRERFWRLVDRLGIPTAMAKLMSRSSASLGRRHVARLLVQIGAARSPHEAWHRFVSPASRELLATPWPSIEHAIGTVLDAGGVASLAHPPGWIAESELAFLKHAGLQAVEAVYPWPQAASTLRLRQLARQLQLAVTGGSDCHQREEKRRAIGTIVITREEFQHLRELAQIRQRLNSLHSAYSSSNSESHR